jgi:hypothetical protein
VTAYHRERRVAWTEASEIVVVREANPDFEGGKAMTYAAVTYVNLEGRERADGLKMLNDVLVPRIKSLAGFQSARFLSSPDGKSGIGAVICDTESHARACLDAMAIERPAEAPPVTSTALYEVVLEV